MKHSPGPWHFYDYPDYKGPKTRAQIRDVNGAIIALTASTGGEYYMAPKDAETIQANARLIAAAPELLSAVQYLLLRVHRHLADENVLKHIQQIIESFQGE